MGYESSSATALVATSCAFCGRPLVDAHSLQLGIGPICAEKYGMNDPTGSPDWDLYRDRLETAPDPVKESASRANPGDAHSIINHLLYPAGTYWENNLPGRQLVLASVAELADALGYQRVAQKIIARYVTGDDTNAPAGAGGIGVTAYESGGTWWTFRLPKRLGSRFRDFSRAMEKAGGKYDKKYNVHFRYREETDWIKMLNVLVADFSGSVGVLPTGEVFVVPDEPLPLPGPAGSADKAASPEESPAKETLLTLDPRQIQIGMEVVRSDGTRAYVRWKGNKNGEWRIGITETLEQRGGYEFCGLNDVRVKPPTAADEKAVQDQLQGEDEAPPARPISTRQLPEGLYGYQREVSLWADSQGSGLLALEPGLGKTPISLSIVDKPCVVICPNNLKYNWVEECLKWRPDLTVAAVGTGRLLTKKELKDRGLPAASEKDRREGTIQLQMSADVVVVNYEQLQKKERVAQLIERKNRTVIIDESHRMKELRIGAKKDKSGNWYADPWKTSPVTAVGAWDVAREAPRRFLLTGTPQPNGLNSELFGQLHTVAPTETAFRTFKQFSERYCPGHDVYVGQGRHITMYDVNDDTQGLRSLINGRLMLIKRQVECLDLPAITRRSKFIPLEPESAKAYREAAADLLDFIQRSGGKEAMDRAARAKAIVKMTTLHKISAIGKTPAFGEEIARHISGTGRPVVVMAHHEEAAVALTEFLSQVHEDKDIGLKRPLGVGVYGWGTSAKRMHEVKTHFQTGLPETSPPEERSYLDVLVCSIMAAREGITLTRANDMFLLERVFTPAYMMQAEKRIHRISQDKPVTYYYYDGSGTIDATITKILIRKIREIESFMRGEEMDEEDASDLILGDILDTLAASRDEMAANAASASDLGWNDPDE